MFFKVILFLIIIKSLSSLNSNDFCYSNEVICLNNRECTKECNDLLRKYKCSGQLCTINETKCNEYINEEWFDMLSLSYSNRINRFKSKVKNCSKAVFKLNSNDVCTNKNKICFKKYSYFDWISTNTYTIKKRADCDCNGKYTYKCGDHFCTVNNKACDAFMVLKPNFKHKIKILYCN